MTQLSLVPQDPLDVPGLRCGECLEWERVQGAVGSCARGWGRYNPHLGLENWAHRYDPCIGRQAVEWWKTNGHRWVQDTERGFWRPWAEVEGIGRG